MSETIDIGEIATALAERSIALIEQDLPLQQVCRSCRQAWII